MEITWAIDEMLPMHRVNELFVDQRRFALPVARVESIAGVGALKVRIRAT